ncbi:MAG: pilus assembly protein PilP [Gammaproteobacteria bacterium]
MMGNSDTKQTRGGAKGIAHWPAAALLGVCLGLAGCQSSPHGDLDQWVKKVKSEQRGHVAPLPEVKPYETYTYNDKDLRDPFKPYIPEAERRRRQAEANTKLRPDQNRRREALEAFSLDSLKFVGTLEKKGQTWALIQAPDHTVHRVQVGNHMGQNYGKITRITENKVSLREIIPNGLGGWVERNAALTLK